MASPESISRAHCDNCGNPLDDPGISCPYCGKSVAHISVMDPSALVVINLEEGRPTVEEALQVFHDELGRIDSSRFKLIKIIHGYGASGVGGAIRKAVLRELDNMHASHKIKSFIPGANLKRLRTDYRDLVKRHPRLASYSGKANRGITFVILD